MDHNRLFCLKHETSLLGGHGRPCKASEGGMRARKRSRSGIGGGTRQRHDAENQRRGGHGESAPGEEAWKRGKAKTKGPEGAGGIKAMGQRRHMGTTACLERMARAKGPKAKRREAWNAPSHPVTQIRMGWGSPNSRVTSRHFN